MKRAHPIRMCIACRRRYPQKTLIRLKHDEHGIVRYNGFGRSFYICPECAQNEKKQRGLIKRFKRHGEGLVKLLKEFVHDGEN